MEEALHNWTFMSPAVRRICVICFDTKSCVDNVRMFHFIKNEYWTQITCWDCNMDHWTEFCIGFSSPYIFCFKGSNESIKNINVYLIILLNITNTRVHMKTNKVSFKNNTIFSVFFSQFFLENIWKLKFIFGNMSLVFNN